MRVFVTGASGFIGSAVVPELIAAGHEVVGLVRSDASAAVLRAAGAEVQRGALEDLESLRAGASKANAVVHLAFVHDFAHFEASARTDERAIQALGTAIEGSERPLVIASGFMGFGPGRVATERDEPAPGNPRLAGVSMALSFVSRGVRTSIVRLSPSVHGRGDHGFVPRLIAIAREKGVSGYIGDGSNHWPAVHRFDAARLFRLALEKAPAGAKLHGVADEGVATRTIAVVIGRRLNVPVASLPPEGAEQHFGWLARFFAMDIRASSASTRELLGWQPDYASLVADLEMGHYFGP